MRMRYLQGNRQPVSAIALCAGLVLLLASCSQPPAAPALTAPGGASAPSSTVAPAPAAPAALVPVRYATQASITDATIFLAHARGYFEQEGLAVELVNFASANDMVPALATGQVEVGATAPIAAFFNAYLGGVEIKSVAERASNLPGHGSSALIARNDLADNGRFRPFADLKGLQVGMTPPLWGGGTAPPLMVALERGGLSQDDITGVALPSPEMDIALRNGAVDAVLTVEPYISRAVSGGYGVRWQGVDEFYTGHMLGAFAYAPNFAAQQPDAARAFMVAYVRAAREYNTILRAGDRKDELFDILAEYSTLKDRRVIEQVVLPGVKPDPYIDRESVARDLDAYLKLGTVKERVAIDRLVDDQYVRY